MTVIVRLVSSLLALSFAGCVATPLRVPPDATANAFYVVRRAQHTGIAIPAQWWPDATLLASFPDAKYLELGWGDAKYYPALRKNALMALDAVFTPSASVMSVLGLPDISAVRPDGIERVPASASELQSMVASINESFASRQAIGTRRRLVEGELLFYPARGNFYFFRMCNDWTVTRLRAAGCKVSGLPVITAGRALREARRCAAMRDAP
jgi:hypothetical protein